jgi:short-subunit dehydrogenase
MNSPQDQNILVTGASSGLGREIARALAGEGMRLCATGRRTARLDALRSELGEGLTPCQIDMGEPAQMDEFMASLPQREFTGLILNAGVTFADEFMSGSDENDAALFDINVTANLRLMRAQIALWQKTGQGGRILIIASLGGIVPLPYQAVYSGSKAFLVNFGLALREELSGTGIEVIIFAPGGIKTEMTDVEAMAGLQKHLASPEKIGRAAIAAYYGRKALVIPGFENKLAAMLYRVLPRSLVLRQTAKIYRQARRPN